MMMNETQLEEKAELDVETAEFLDKQANTLLTLMDDPNITSQEREQTALKLESLLGKIYFELNDIETEQRI